MVLQKDRSPVWTSRHGCSRRCLWQIERFHEQRRRYAVPSFSGLLSSTVAVVFCGGKVNIVGLPR